MVLRISDDLKLPNETATSTLVVYGGKGMGKTNFASVLAEELSASRQRFAAIDPMGVMWGLRHSADGKGPGVEVLVLGGRHGDIPIEPTAGAVVADLVADEEVDVVVDIKCDAAGKTWSIGQRIRFVADFVERLHERQGERMRPLMLIVDEAGRFCPQTIPHGAPDVARCCGAVERLVEEGRNVGVGVALITQRSARMNKSVSELADCMVAFRTVGPRSVAAILDWFGEHVAKERWNDLSAKLRKLERGTALVVSPGWLEFEGAARIRARRTFDSSSTPKAGQVRAAGTGARPNLGRYQERLKETIERAEADNPRKLRARIVELEKQLATRRAEPERVAVPREVEVYVSAVSHEMVAELRAAHTPLAAAIERLDRALSSVRSSPTAVVQMQRGVPRMVEPQRPTTKHRPGFDPFAARPERTAAQDAEIGGGAARMVVVLGSVHPKKLSRPELGVHSLLASNAGGFRNCLSELRSSGILDEEGGRIGLRRHVGPPHPVRGADELARAWASKLGGSASRMLRQLIDVYPAGMTRQALGAAVGLEAAAGGFRNCLSELSFRNCLSELNGPGLIEKRGGEVYASPALFLGGR